MKDVLVKGLVKRYGGADSVAAVDDVDLDIAAGEFLVLLGPSGCGKTTLLRSLAGLETPTEGRIRFGEDVVFDAASGIDHSPERRNIGMVFQNYSLWPHMSVERNVSYPLKARRTAKPERHTRVASALETVQCTALAGRLPAMLSGGQQQRIALARALVSNPEVMLLDEPLSNLDALLRVDLRDQLRDLHRTLGFTGVYVTHDQLEAFTLGTRVAVMRSGRIEQLGTPEHVYRHPATEEVAAFLGIRNVLTLRHDADEWRSAAGVVRGRLLRSLHAGREYRCFVRPEHVMLLPAGSDRPGTARDVEDVDGVLLPPGVVLDVRFAGQHLEYVVDVGGQTLHVSSPEVEHRFDVGAPVEARVRDEHCVIYHDARLVSERAPARLGLTTGGA